MNGNMIGLLKFIILLLRTIYYTNKVEPSINNWKDKFKNKSHFELFHNHVFRNCLQIVMILHSISNHISEILLTWITQTVMNVKLVIKLTKRIVYHAYVVWWTLLDIPEPPNGKENRYKAVGRWYFYLGWRLECLSDCFLLSCCF